MSPVLESPYQKKLRQAEDIATYLSNDLLVSGECRDLIRGRLQTAYLAGVEQGLSMGFAPSPGIKNTVEYRGVYRGIDE